MVHGVHYVLKQALVERVLLAGLDHHAHHRLAPVLATVRLHTCQRPTPVQQVMRGGQFDFVGLSSRTLCCTPTGVHRT